MKLALQILGTIVIIAGAAFFYILGPAIASSSHHIALADREAAMANSKLAIIIGPLLLIAVWIPWKRLFKKATRKASSTT